MSETILATEATIRLAIFLGVLAAMALWEVAAPRRRLVDLHRFCSDQVLMLCGPLFEGHGGFPAEG